MKNVVLGSFVLLTSALTGCVTSNSGDDTTGGDVLTTANWQFSTISADGSHETASACPGAPFDTAAVLSVSEDANGTHDIASCTGASTSGSTCVVDLYDCTAMTGTETLPPGYWAQFVSITDHSGANVWGDSKAQLTNLTVDNSINVDLIDNGGYILASWHLVNGGQPTTCAAVAGQNGVIIDATVVNGAKLISDAFDCDKGEFGFQYTDPLPADDYTLSVSVVDTADATIGNPTNSTITLGDQNDIKDAGDIEIDVAP